jgi:hypothetical protein
MESDAVRAHALRLLFDHLIADTVEIWRDDAVDRDDVRSAVRPATHR